MNVPLGTGDVFGPKLNSLMSYADAHPDEFPKGGIRTLEDAIGTLLEIDIQYYARVDFAGFVAMVDAVGGRTSTSRRRSVHPATTVSASRPSGSWSGRASTISRAPRLLPTHGSAREPAKATSREPTASSRSSSRCAIADERRQHPVRAAGASRRWATPSRRTSPVERLPEFAAIT